MHTNLACGSLCCSSRCTLLIWWYHLIFTNMGTCVLKAPVSWHIRKYSVDISVCISADSQSTYWPTLGCCTVECRWTCRPRIGQCVDRYLVYMLTSVSWHIDQASVDISADTRSICWPMCSWHLAHQLTYRLSLGWYVGQYVDRVSVDMLTDTWPTNVNRHYQPSISRLSANMLPYTRPKCRPILGR